MPFIGQPPFVVNGLGENGIGDLTASFFFSQRTNSKFTWGVGPASGWVDMAASMYIRGAMSHTHPMLRSVLKSQYHASLAMLREAVERCPPEEWESARPFTQRKSPRAVSRSAGSPSCS